MARRLPRSGCAASAPVLLSRHLCRAVCRAIPPSTIGTDAVRLALLWRQRVSLRAAFLAVGIDRVCGVGAILVLMYVGMPFALDLLPAGAAIPIAATTAVLLAGCAVLLFVDRLPLRPALRRGWLGRPLSLIGDLRAALGAPQAVVALLFSIAIHALGIVGILLLARAFGYGFSDDVPAAIQKLYRVLLFTQGADASAACARRAIHSTDRRCAKHVKADS